MKKLKSHFWSISTFVLFFVMAIACVPSQHYTYKKPKPEPCITHKGLSYSPVLVTFYISGSYNMENLSNAQTSVPNILLNKLNGLSYGKYQIANGVTPNLNLYVDYKTDNYGHYGADIKGYVYDGDFHTWTENNFVTFDRLDDEVASKVNAYIMYGWCKNCTGPCNP